MPRGATVVIVRRDRRPPTGVSAGWLDRVAIVERDIVDTALLRAPGSLAHWTFGQS